MKPNFFIVGMPRSGTTSMYTYLRQHPDVFLSVLKEPHHFGSDLSEAPWFIRDEELYLSLFDEANGCKRIGEASVWYLASVKAAEEIRSFEPSSKIIIMLRNPVDMVWSIHRLGLRTGNENLADLRAALAAERDRREGRRIPPGAFLPEALQYRELGKFHEKVKRFLDAVGSENVHIVRFEEFVTSPKKIFAETLGFLGVDDTFRPEFDLAKAGTALRMQSVRLLRTARPEVRAKFRLVKFDAHQDPSHDPIDAELRRELTEYYCQNLQQLGALLGRNFDDWGPTGTREASGSARR